METVFNQQPLVYLPDDLLERILGRSTAVAEQIGDIYEQLAQVRAEMREALLREDRIRNLDDLDVQEQQPTVAAIDGGHDYIVFSTMRIGDEELSRGYFMRVEAYPIDPFGLGVEVIKEEKLHRLW